MLDWVEFIPLIANPVPSITEEKQRGRGSRAWYWALGAVFLAVYAGSMFTPGLLDDADSTHAEAAREMVVTGDYVTLHINGVRYLEKPPLPYWLVAFSYKVFGVNEFSTRLPMVLSVMLLGVLGFCWGRRAFGERTGIYAGLFVYTCAGVYLFTRILIPDVLLSLLIAGSVSLFLTALAVEPEDRDDLRSDGTLVIRLSAPENLSAVSPARFLFMREAVALEPVAWSIPCGPEIAP